jgi:hypothetical protein
MGGPEHAPRYTVIPHFEDTSEGGHDEWLVIDEGQDPVCSCFDEADALMIADALNAQAVGQRLK